MKIEDESDSNNPITDATLIQTWISGTLLYIDTWYDQKQQQQAGNMGCSLPQKCLLQISKNNGGLPRVVVLQGATLESLQPKDITRAQTIALVSQQSASYTNSLFSIKYTNYQNLLNGSLTATQSSTNGAYAASNAIDGNLNCATNYVETNLGTNSWWKVDLGAPAYIGYVKIFERTSLD